MALSSWAERIRAGDVRALARAMTAVENREPAAALLLKEMFPASGEAAVIGITGAPGSGKSTLTDRLTAAYRARLQTVGIVAVDPSSPFRGGAILGDRIRMQQHHADPGVFIRSMATRGFLGGLAEATTDVVTLLDAARRHRIIVETVGVGQDEVDIIKLADVTVVVLVPGMGDEVQTLKAGIMEIGDVFVINKADRGADRLEQELRAMLQLAPEQAAWHPPIVKTVATEGLGIEDLLAAIEKCLQWLGQDHRLLRRRQSNWSSRLLQLVRERVTARLHDVTGAAELEAMAGDVAARRTDPYSVADELIARLLANDSTSVIAKE
jgi:LAO/AO transport system kinase